MFSLGPGSIWNEFCGEEPTRQVECYGGRWFSSRQPYHEGLGPGLAEGPLSAMDYEPENEITAEEFERAWRAGRVDAAVVNERDARLTAAERSGIDALIARRDYSLPAGLMSLCVDMLVRIHGFVVMEAFGQLRPLASDPAATFGRTIDECLSAVGLGRQDDRRDR